MANDQSRMREQSSRDTEYAINSTLQLFGVGEEELKLIGISIDDIVFNKEEIDKIDFAGKRELMNEDYIKAMRLRTLAGICYAVICYNALAALSLNSAQKSAYYSYKNNGAEQFERRAILTEMCIEAYKTILRDKPSADFLGGVANVYLHIGWAYAYAAESQFHLQNLKTPKKLDKARYFWSMAGEYFSMGNIEPMDNPIYRSLHHVFNLALELSNKKEM